MCMCVCTLCPHTGVLCVACGGDGEAELPEGQEVHAASEKDLKD